MSPPPIRLNAGVQPNNPKYDPTQEGLLYLKADGKTPTAAIKEAAHGPNFDITVSELVDRNGRVLFTIMPPTKVEIPEDQYPADGKATSSVDEATGIITITTYLKELSSQISRNPDWVKGSTTAYKYLTASGTGTHNADEAAKVYQYNPNFGKSLATMAGTTQSQTVPSGLSRTTAQAPMFRRRPGTPRRTPNTIRPIFPVTATLK